MAKSCHFDVSMTLKERELIDKVILLESLKSRRELIFLLISRQYLNLDDRIIKLVKSAELESCRRHFIKYGKMHHDTFMTAMEFTQKMISRDEILDKIIIPTIHILELQEIPDGVIALKRLKTWLEDDPDSFEQYANKYWHDKTRISDMIKRLEVEHFTRAIKHCEEVEKRGMEKSTNTNPRL